MGAISPKTAQRHRRVLERRRDFLEQSLKEQGYAGRSYDLAELSALKWVLRVVEDEPEASAVVKDPDRQFGAEMDDER